jgi:UPF0042 nucleotide-binding protein
MSDVPLTTISRAPARATPPKQVVVVSGLAGAGKTTAARALEDLGFFVVDNLPPQLIETLVSLSGDDRPRIAFVVDARDEADLHEFPATWARLGEAGHRRLLLFLDCADDIAIRRFQETRRRHPLDRSTDGDSGLGDSALLTAIARERALLDDLRGLADAVIDTGELSVHELRRLVVECFGAAEARLHATLVSFGFKRGLPTELDLCFDARFLPNPFFVEGLRAGSGLDAPVRDFVLQQPDAIAFLDKVVDLVAFLLPRFAAEGKSYATVAIGCTGGRHRSVALVEAAVLRLRTAGFDVGARHRDLERGHR